MPNVCRVTPSVPKPRQHHLLLYIPCQPIQNPDASFARSEVGDGNNNTANISPVFRPDVLPLFRKQLPRVPPSAAFRFGEDQTGQLVYIIPCGIHYSRLLLKRHSIFCIAIKILRSGMLLKRRAIKAKSSNYLRVRSNLYEVSDTLTVFPNQVRLDSVPFEESF